MKTLTIVATFAGALASATPSFAADLIEDYPRVVHRQKAYVAQTYEMCSTLMIDYRRPYNPHREYVAVCYPPLDLSPSSSSSSRETSAPPRQNYVLR